MHFTRINFLPVHSNKNISHLFIKMAEASIDNLMSSLYDAPQTEAKQQKLLECILTGNSKLYLGKVYTEEQVNELSDEEVDKLFNNYEAKLSGQMVKSLGKSIINMYSMGACAALGINQDVLSEDLKSDPFPNSALQRFTCELYYRFGSFLAPLSVGLITSRHYLNVIKMEERVETTEEPMSLGAAMATAIVIGFWSGIGVIFAAKMVHNLEDCIEELINRKCQ